MPTNVFMRPESDENDDISLSMSSSSLFGRSGSFSNNLLFRRSFKQLILSSRDISASSRLSGYLLIFIAYVVLFVSSLQKDDDSNNDGGDNLLLLQISEWKQQSSIIGSAAFSGLMVFIVLIHFDTFCLPHFWFKIFAAGSIGEGIILIILCFAAIFIVTVSTSANGLGGVVGKGYNIYFSSWMGFFTCVYTFYLWIKSATLNSRNHALHSLSKISCLSKRKTNIDWVWTLFFSFITFCSILDIYFLDDSNKGAEIPLAENQLALMLISSGGSVFCCCLSLIMNMIVSAQCCSRCTLYRRIWYKVEVLFILILIGFWSWAVFTFTGINGLVNGPSNSYFGVWGCFFWSISIFGSWRAEYSSLH